MKHAMQRFSLKFRLPEILTNKYNNIWFVQMGAEIVIYSHFWTLLVQFVTTGWLAGSKYSYLGEDIHRSIAANSKKAMLCENETWMWSKMLMQKRLVRNQSFPKPKWNNLVVEIWHTVILVGTTIQNAIHCNVCIHSKWISIFQTFSIHSQQNHSQFTTKR